MPTTSTLTNDPALDAQVFWHKFRREIVGAIFLAILVTIGIAAYWVYAERQESAASDLLATAKNPSGYEQVIARYPNAAATASAYLFLAEAQRNDRKFAEANTTLQTFLGKHPKHELAGAAEVAIATNLESLGKRDEALAMYRQIAVKYSSSYSAPLALISAVRILKEKNQTNEARLVCETLINQYAASYWASEAMRELGALKPAEPATPASPASGSTLAGTPAPAIRPPLALPGAAPSAAASTAAPTAKPKP